MVELDVNVKMWAWLTASTVNLVGTLSTAAALPIVIYQATGNASAVSMLAVIEAVPYLVLGIGAGWMADRYNRQRLIIAGFTLSAMVSAVQAVGLLSGVHLVLVYCCATISAIVFTGTDAAEFGLLPQVIPEDRLPQAWGLSTVLTNSCSVLVPAVAATTVALLGATPILVLDSVSFLLAAVLISRLTLLPPGGSPESAAENNNQDATGERGWRAGIVYIWSHSTLRPLVLSGLLNSAAFGAVTALLVVFAVDALGSPPASTQTGVTFASVALGGMLMGLAFDRIYSPQRIRLLTLIGTMGSAGSIALLIPSTTVIYASVVLILYGACLSLTITSGIVFRQSVAPECIRSRVMTVGRMIAWGGQPLGAAAAGIIATAWGIRSAYLLPTGLFVVAFMIASLIVRPSRTQLSVACRG
ncbi:MAG: hypothetical protein QG671_862 [Actinomycetota bacterium]|nr:hypothetical protein [Actinomycetota bacterium]